MYSKKIDIETNNPRKLFRGIVDLMEEHMEKRKNKESQKKDPEFESPMEGVAHFNASYDVEIPVKYFHKGRIVAGAILTALGIGWWFFKSYITIVSLDEFTSMMVTAGLLIVGIILLVIQVKTHFIAEIKLDGESYIYKGSKENAKSDFENRERADVVSDVRITLEGLVFGSNPRKKDHEEFEKDLDFLYNKLLEVIPEYRIPA